MESSDNYNSNLFQPRNLHGRKNRNVILTMLLIWAVAVFGFQFLLRAIEKPVPERALENFEKLWPSVHAGQGTQDDKMVLLNSLILARGKITLSAEDKKLFSEAISTVANQLLPDDIKTELSASVTEINVLKAKVPELKDQEYLDAKKKIAELSDKIIGLTASHTGVKKTSLESSILTLSLKSEFPESIGDKAFESLGERMKLYMTHNQSFLTDAIFLGFPFHYFYTAVFLLILFVSLCIIYNLLIEWRLKKQGVIE